MTTITLADCRREVRAFAILMETELRANDHKPGWKNDTPLSLATRVSEEAKELWDAVMLFEDWGLHLPNENPESRIEMRKKTVEIAKEAADVANMAMMVVDVYGLLSKPPVYPLTGDEVEDVTGQLCDAIGCLAYLDEGQYRESDGSIVLDESQIVHMRCAIRFLNEVQDVFARAATKLREETRAWQSIADRELAALERLSKAVSAIGPSLLAPHDQRFGCDESTPLWLELNDAQHHAKQILGNTIAST